MNTLIETNTNESISDACKLFQDTKSNINTTEIDIDSLYAPAIILALIMDSTEQSEDIASRKGFDKLMALSEDMHSKANNEIATVHCDTMIINAYVQVHQYQHALRVFGNVFKNKQKDEYFKNRDFCLAILRCYGSSNRIMEGIDFMQDIESEYDIIADNEMYYALLRGIVINSRNKSLYLRVAQKLFEQTFGDSNLDKYPNILIFQSMIDIYSKIGDINTCLNIMNYMMENEYCCNPNHVICNLVMKACLKCEDKELLIKNENGWTYIDHVLEIMDQLNIPKNDYIYNTLFAFCGANYLSNIEPKYPDFERLNKYYQEMSDQQLNASHDTLEKWIMSAMDWFQHQYTINDSENMNSEKKETEGGETIYL